ncbi:3-oxoacyl-[acyl-carrier protein] reductase [Pseudochelatococcus lubricantis]|uniref:3-oxoacyl-[acyl-carrier protein] reductase n=1 Tax=Pseudochelatococcus lubricantis TaxID=1538102 RepID=A0ABX0V108_9HYPH|nr:SDR family oxidoreductase [Pseudochelatococcus lubricantis]NIJ58879.1 3-oxoacyl-[acyl-carrier protein] reductase [Pseudochelatococcus lubricantis]
MTQIAVVTGATAGLGEIIARTLHGAGYRVAVTGRNHARALEIAAELDGTGETAVGLELEIAKRDHFEAALAQVVEKWGRVDVLVNNASVTRAQPVLDITTEEFNEVMAINAGGTFTGSQVFGRYFRDRGYGRIINLASLAGQNGGTATGAHYAASKGAILTLTKVFARDLAPYGVTVNAIAPGPLDSPIVHRTIPADRMPGVLSTIPVGTLGSQEFVARTVLHLASPDAGFVTGATWDINGGLYLR